MYVNHYTFKEINQTKCFKFEDNIYEVLVSMERLIISEKLSIKLLDEKILNLIFEEIIPGWLLNSEFNLKLQEIQLNEKLDLFFKKIKILDEDNKEKNKKIKNLEYKLEKIQEENKNFNQELIFLKDNLIKLKELSIPFEIRDEIVKDFHMKKNLKILNIDEISLIKEWFGKEFRMDLIYSSDIHGKQVKTFHKLCDGIENTFILVDTESSSDGFLGKFNKKITKLGGFTKLKWSSDYGYVHGDGSEFIFSLTKKRMFKNNKNPEYAIFNNSNYFPTFGAGDLVLDKECFSTNKSFSSLQSSYGNGELLDEDREKYLAGNKNFNVLKIEVFKINFL